MNFSNPILVCDENEDFRLLLREMLTKNGFFHVVEATTEDEVLLQMKEHSNFLVLIEQKLLTPKITSIIRKQKNYIIFADNHSEKTTLLAATLGVGHIMSYPFHSKGLIEKMNSLL